MNDYQKLKQYLIDIKSPKKYIQCIEKRDTTNQNLRRYLHNILDTNNNISNDLKIEIMSWLYRG